MKPSSSAVAEAFSFVYVAQTQLNWPELTDLVTPSILVMRTVQRHVGVRADWLQTLQARSHGSPTGEISFPLVCTCSELYSRVQFSFFESMRYEQGIRQTRRWAGLPVAALMAPLSHDRCSVRRRLPAAWTWRRWPKLDVNGRQIYLPQSYI